MLLTKHYPHKYFGLQGDICSIGLKSQLQNNTDGFIKLTWILDNFKKFQKLINLRGVRVCYYTLSCLEIPIYAEGKLQKVYYIMSYDDGANWFEVHTKCKSIGATLPQFESKEKIIQFTAMFKHVRRLKEIFAIPIGLQYNTSKVSKEKTG